MFQKSLIALAALLLCLPVSSAEKVIAKFKDCTLKTDLTTKWSSTSKAARAINDF